MEKEIQRYRMVCSSSRCFIGSFFVIALRVFGLEQALELVTADDDDEETSVTMKW